MRINIWLRNYQKDYISGDISAGIVVAIMLIPQAMAYALLAGLPPQTGLYACIVPLLVYGLLGSSNFLAVGPVAIVSIMVAGSLGGLAEAGSAEYQSLAITLAMMIGIIMIVFGFLRFGGLVNFLSQPVISGFINAAALIIAVSQLQHFLGFNIPRGESTFEKVGFAVQNIDQVNPTTLLLGLAALGLLLFSRNPLAVILRRLGVAENIISIVTKTGALIVVILGSACVRWLDLNDIAGVAIVGSVPAGLPSLTIPDVDLSVLESLLPSAALIAFVVYLESISVARSLASKRHQRVGRNRELVALGAANIGASLTGAFPVAGGFARSSVNFSAGANTPAASLVTVFLMLPMTTFMVPFFFYLPNVVLASVVFVATIRLLDIKPFLEAWRFNRGDALSILFTFLMVLTLGIEIGILGGAVFSIMLYLRRTSHPHMAIVGRVGNSEHFRNVLRRDVITYSNIVALRVDENLYFANVDALEEELLRITSEKRDLEHVVLICSAINFIDASALESLKAIVERLHNSGVTFHLAEIKGPVMDSLEKSNLFESMGAGKIYMSTHDAIVDLQGSK